MSGEPHGTPRGGGGPGGRQLRREKPKNLRGTLLRIFGYLRGNKLLVALILGCLLVSTASGIAGSYALQPLIDDYILPGNFRGLAIVLSMLGCLYLLGLGAAYLQTRTTIKLAQRTTNIIRRELFGKLQDLPLRYHDSHTHGELMSRFTNDADNVQTMLEQSLTQLLSSCITFVGCVVCMLVISPVLFIMSALILALMTLAVRKLGARSQRNFQEQQRLLGELSGLVEESVGGLREIKAFNHEERSKSDFEQLNGSFRQAAENANFIAGAIMPIMGNLNNISYSLAAVFGGVLAAFGMMKIGAIASYLQFTRQVGQPINQISNQLNNIFAAVAGAERIFALMDEEPEVDDGTVALVPDGRGEDGEPRWSWVLGDGTRVPLRGDVRFDRVHFAYDPQSPVLADVSLYAKPGQMIAFVGSTGAGKTTITNLINRFYDVQQGRITYDGIDVKEIKKESLRRSLGMVLQDTHLFTGSVLDNIRYGRLDATDEECVEAAKKASADSFIRRLPAGYKTKLKGDGDNLSQGQRQLLAIARAYISQPPVMILDEATSSIDTRTERLVQRGMSELMKGRTVFVIAHRLSTVRNAKAIIVLEHGEIIERGSHEELLEQHGRYYQLYKGLSILT